MIIDAVPGVTFTPDINDPDNRQDSRFFSGQVMVNQVISPSLVIGGYYQGLSTERTNNNGLLGIGFQSASTTLFDGTIHTANAHVNWTAAERNTLTAGYEFEKESFGNSGSTPSGADNFSTSACQSSNTFYVQNILSLASGRLQVAGGFRAQWFSLERPTFSSASYPRRFDNPVSPPASYTGDGALSYYFAKTGTKLRVHAGNGYRVPSLFERFGSFFFLNAFSGLGNPALKPERSFAIDGGIEQDLAEDRLRLTATYFYTRINDEVSFLPTDDLGAPAYFNFDKHFSRGAEFSARARLTGRTEIFASYTFTNSDIRTHTRQTFMPPFSIIGRDNPAFGIPDHQFTISATQRFKRFWVNFDFLATSVYRAPIFDTNAFTFQTYVYRFKGNRKGDLTAGYTFGFRNESKTLRLFGTIENVFDQEYFENGFRTAGASARFGVSFGF